jgi:glycine oxidase
MPAQGGNLPEPHRQSPDVAVIGGGLIGLAVAWSVLQRGLRVTVLERDAAPAAGASHVAAGMLAPTSEAARGEEALLALGLRSADLYESWCGELAEAAGEDPGLRRCGALMVARDRDDAEVLERELEFRASLDLDVVRLRPSEARRREPALAPTVRLALDIADDHAIDPRRLALVLHAAVLRAGGNIEQGAGPAALACRDGRVDGVVLASGERLSAGQVVVAAGAWSGQLAGLPPDARVPVRPVKGQILRLRDPAGAGLLRRIVRLPDAYIVPRGDGRYVIGATVEERGWDTQPTAGGVFELLRSARKVLPGADEWVVEEVGAGLRPGTPDNAPVLGPGTIDGLLWATGHHRNGILLAPVTGETLAAVLAGEPVPDVVVPFDARRFDPAAVPA